MFGGIEYSMLFVIIKIRKSGVELDVNKQEVDR